MKQHLIGLGLAAATAMAVPAHAQELRFTTWSGNERHLAMLNGFAESFAVDHPGVTVRFETIPFGEYVQLITLQIAGDNPPDIGWLLETAAPSFIEAGVLMDVSGALAATDDYNFADFSAPAMELWQDGDAVYGVPFSTSPLMFFYNADMFEAAGVPNPAEQAANGDWTWEAFRNTAAALTSDDVYGFQTKDGAGYDARIMQFLMPVVAAYGGHAWENGECGLDSPAAVEAISLLHGAIFEDGSIVPPGEQDNFFSGGAAMTINQISRTSQLADATFEWGIAPLPTGPGGQRADSIGQAAVVAFAASEHADLAAQFLAHITNEENVATMAEFFPPIRASVLGTDAFLTSNALLSEEEMQMVANAIGTGTIHDAHANYARIMAAAQPRFDALFRADADVARAMEAVCAAIEPNL